MTAFCRYFGVVVLAFGVGLGQQSHANESLFTLNLQEVPLRDALQVLADELDLNLVMSKDIEGNVSTHIEALSIEQAIAVLLFDTGFDFRLQDNLLVVGPSAVLADFDDSQRTRAQLADALETVYLPLSYADGRQLVELLGGNADTGRESVESGGLLSVRGTARVDVRTNTLILQDTASHLAAVRALINQLDVAVRQVLIEARIVSASLDSGRELGLRWGFMRDSAASAVSAQNLFVANADHYSPSLAQAVFMRSQQMLDLELSALERAGEAELIARPRVTTQDNTPALIQSGVRIPYQAQAGGTAGGSITQFMDAVLALEVTPLITPDGRIMMQLDIRQDAVAVGSADVPAINTNTIRTRVLVSDGETLVLGGIFREEQTRGEISTPLLRRIPLLGALFRRENMTAQRTELLLFITPQIVADTSGE